MTGPLRWQSLAAYATLRVPLALLELPLYVVLPAFYGRTLGVDLTTIGAVLFAVRLLDALADPVIGASIDRHRNRLDDRRWIGMGLPFLAIGFAAMLMPPVTGGMLPAWLAITSALSYLAYSVVSIAYQSWGAALGQTPAERARVTATREGFGLAGVLAATALLAPERVTTLVAAFFALAVVCWIALRAAPTPTRASSHASGGIQAGGDARLPDAVGAWRTVFRVPSFRWLLAAFALNGIANAIPATLVLFFVRDVLGAGDGDAGLFLGAYFLAGALGMPLWTRVARRFGLRNAWLLGIAFSVLAFTWALGLDRGDTQAFLVVCLVTGLALGSDLAMPPALLATVIAEAGHAGRREGAYFGVWNLATKLCLAGAAGVALPLLGWLDYTPGQAGGALALGLVYAALPCALKLAAGIALLLAPLPDPLSKPALSKEAT